MQPEWKEQFKTDLIKKFGKKGMELFDKYAPNLPPSYCDDQDSSVAVNDVMHMEQLSADHQLSLDFYIEKKSGQPLHLRLYQWEKTIPLSDILPMLENLGLRTDSEHPYDVNFKKYTIWVSDFTLIYQDPNFDIEAAKPLFEDSFSKIYFGLSENDGFNKLVLHALLSSDDIKVLRAYAKYLHQVGFRFSQSYIETAFINNASITRDLFQLFLIMHDPKKASKSKEKAENIEASILKALDQVSSLDEDRIIRRLLDLIKATLRTNYFQKTKEESQKAYISFKFDSQAIPELPLPKPYCEIFVYSPRFEGIHLRNDKVARGGIRWSDRKEDFRTEILGLMKAQVVKNAVIVPSGAKGGFVLKKQTQDMSREELKSEVIACYESFISGLLDLTDNIKKNKKIPPKNVYCYDEPDPYLVIAADKGTASFSDIANRISKEYDFWLGDAFASGGKTGYDHKKIGITARGAWESIKRHFTELNIDIMHQSITVVGIGDMSGDVFGNGMLYTKHIKLVGAFDHRHIFLDPNPKTEESFNERKRLFNLPASSWDDYNKKLISKGGGVYSRNLKSIPISKQVQDILKIEDEALPPNQLICALLKAPIDLLYNGGIGTYVKAARESNADVSDRTNDYCRVNGEELRCKVVGEGGNLGFTQLGRVEYALNNGIIFTDFIDNSAGVDCSDHEVNLKILLDIEVQKKKLSEKKRNELLASLENQVAELVLEDNYNQALAMSFSAENAHRVISLHMNYLKELESLDVLNRQVEFLPSEKELTERKAANTGLTRPELAVLLAYTKIHIKNELLKSDLPEDPYLRKVVESAFPEDIRRKYQKIMQEHKLHREIIATQLSNDIVNEMGITFIYRLQIETGSEVSEIIRAHAVASQIFGTHELQKLIESLDFKISHHEQYEMLYNIRKLINLSTRWFLHGDHMTDNLESLVTHYAVQIKKIEDLIPVLMSGITKDYLSSLTERFIEVGLSKDIAKRIATYRAIYTALNITEVSSKFKFDLTKTAKVYFAAGERINLLWFRDQIATDSREGHWNALARLTLRDELDLAQRALTIVIIKQDEKEASVTKLIDKWIKNNKKAVDRWERMLSLLLSSTNIDYTMFFIAMRELLSLINATQPKKMLP